MRAFVRGWVQVLKEPGFGPRGEDVKETSPDLPILRREPRTGPLPDSPGMST